MHERSIAKNLLQIILDSVKGCPEKGKVILIRIVMGEFTMIQEELLISAFFELSRSTVAEGAKIEIIHAPLKGQCQHCRKEFNVNQEEFKCPYCGSQDIRIISGEELFVQEIEVENNHIFKE